MPSEMIMPSEMTRLTSGPRRFAGPFAMAALAVVLAGCQTTPGAFGESAGDAAPAPSMNGHGAARPPRPEVPATVAAPAQTGSAAAARSATSAATARRPAEPVAAASPIGPVAAAPSAARSSAATSPAGPTAAMSPDLLGRIRAGLVLPAAADAAVDREFDWYVSNADYLGRVLKRSEPYLHHIVESLDRHGMPLDLALLPIVESAYDPFAYSRGRAAGLWQIIPGTGRYLGLKQNWWYDGRRDVLESTQAALSYLRQLHEQFDGDWLLAVAGYNAGGGSVAQAVRAAEAAGGTTDFWGIRPHLPVETQTYVPRLLALARLAAAPQRYGVSFPVIANRPYFQVVETGGQVNMALAAQVTGIGTEELHRLNPGVNRWATDPDGPHRLLVPADRAERVAAAIADGSGVMGVQWDRHVVRAGETLSALAIEYRTTIGALQDANGLAGDLIRVGQGVMVPLPADVADGRESSASVRAVPAAASGEARDPRRQAYTVRSGDSLWSVAQRYGVEVTELARWNSMSPGDVLSVGRELTVWSDRTVIVANANARIRRVNYTVRRGDSLYRISARFRVSVADLLHWNNLSPERHLQPGQELVLFVDITDQST